MLVAIIGRCLVVENRCIILFVKSTYLVIECLGKFINYLSASSFRISNNNLQFKDSRFLLWPSKCWRLSDVLRDLLSCQSSPNVGVYSFRVNSALPPV